MIVTLSFHFVPAVGCFEENLVKLVQLVFHIVDMAYIDSTSCSSEILVKYSILLTFPDWYSALTVCYVLSASGDLDLISMYRKLSISLCTTTPFMQLCTI